MIENATKLRRQIMEAHLRPLILTDGKARYWDGLHGLHAQPGVLEELRFVEIYDGSDTAVELQRMVHDGCFGEAIGGNS